MEEIDRISESTNFNGIQLLDGTLGAREGAFTTARVGAVESIEVSLDGLLPAASAAAKNATSDIKASAIAVGSGHWHMSKPSKEEVQPGFTIDFEDLEIKGFDDATTAQPITVKLGAKQIKLNVKNTSSGNWTTGSLANATAAVFGSHTVGIDDIDADNNGTITGDEIAEVIANIVGAVKAGTNNPADVVKIGTAAGDAFYKVTADGEKLVFTYAGDATKKADASTKDPVTAAMTALKGQVSVSIASGDGIQTGNPHHAVTDIKEPVVGDSGARAGVAMKLTSDVVADGMRLVVEDKTFVFRTNADSIVGADAAAGEVLIDVSAYATADQINAAIKAMSNHTTANFTITAVSAGATSGVIWIDQTEESLAANNLYTELSDLTSLISANRGGKAAGLKVTMDASTLQDGDAVRIDGQTYQFVSKAGQADITGALIDNLPAGSYVDIEMLGSALTLVVCERR